jgi:DNA-binding NarL/FixJ family response regulator
VVTWLSANDRRRGSSASTQSRGRSGARRTTRHGGDRPQCATRSTIRQLTVEELQVARFVSEGLANKEIAAQMFPLQADDRRRGLASDL